MGNIVKSFGPWVLAAVSFVFGAGVTVGANKADGAKAEIAAHVGPVHQALNERLASLERLASDSAQNSADAKSAAEAAAAETKLTRTAVEQLAAKRGGR